MYPKSSIKTNTLIVLLACLLAADWACGAVVWSQEFNGPSIDSNVWTYDVGGGGFGNGELQYHTARWQNAYIENGNLVIEARRESYNGKSFTSARLKTNGRFAF
jgi:beta-glucanase (GH16 family)